MKSQHLYSKTPVNFFKNVEFTVFKEYSSSAEKYISITHKLMQNKCYCFKRFEYHVNELIRVRTLFLLTRESPWSEIPPTRVGSWPMVNPFVFCACISRPVSPAAIEGLCQTRTRNNNEYSFTPSMVYTAFRNNHEQLVECHNLLVSEVVQNTKQKYNKLI